MHDYNVETKIADDRSLIIQGLPFEPGDKVKVTIRVENATPGNGDRYPLRGQSVRYTDPFGSVAESDWDALR